MIHRWTLPNGLTVLYTPDDGIPLVAATLLIKTGSSHEWPDDAGLASFTADMLPQGTQTHSAAQIAAALESVGTSLGVHSAEDHAEMDVIAPESEIGAAMGIMSELVRSPTFVPGELEKERAQILASLRTRSDGIFTIAHDAWEQAAFGAHPYGRPVDGKEETVKRFTRADLRRWHAAYWRPSNAILGVSGALPLRVMRRAIDAHFKSWKAPGLALSTKPEPPVSDGEQRRKLSSRFEQAYVMTGCLAPAVGTPDFLPLKMFNVILGGGMSSRLFIELREKLGLAYEVSSFFPTRRQTSEWIIYIGLSPENRRRAVQRLDQVLKQVAQKGVSAAEVTQAKQMMKGNFLAEQQMRRRRAWYSAWWEFLGRPPDQVRRYAQRIDAVSTADVNAVARRMLARPRITVEVTPE